MDLRVLVVCPDQTSARLLMQVLSEIGMAGEHTPSISRGIQLLNEHPFDAVILDYRPGRSAEEFLACLRRSAKNRTTMLMAVVDEELNARPLFGLGANFVLYRPLSLERTRLSLRAARGLMRRERRRTPRARMSSTAKVSYPGAPDLNATVANVSEGGALITTRNHLPIACKMYFEFALPGQQPLVRLSGEVAWQDSSGCIGIRFLDVPQTSRRLIQSWLRQSGALQLGKTQNPAPASTSPPALGAQPGAPQKPLSASNAGNRRTAHRFPCSIGAEVYRFGTTIPNHCTLSDISEGGCYVEMPTPFAAESGVEILVHTSELKFRIRGQVQATHPGFGMGVRFMFRDSAEREEILRLLAILASGPAVSEQSL